MQHQPQSSDPFAANVDYWAYTPAPAQYTPLYPAQYTPASTPAPLPLTHTPTYKKRQNSHRRATSDSPLGVYDGPITYGGQVLGPPLDRRPILHHQPTSPTYRDQDTAVAIFREATRPKLGRVASRKQHHEPETNPEQVLVTLSSSNTLKIVHPAHALAHSRVTTEISSYWYGNAPQIDQELTCMTIRYDGNPWTADTNATAGIDSRRMICRLFELLEQAGYRFSAIANPSAPSPTMVFSSSPPTAYTPQYFALAYSKSSRKVIIIDAPPHVRVAIIGAVKNSFENPSDPVWLSASVTCIRMVQSGTIQRDMLPRMMGHVVETIRANRFQWEASVPFGREGFLGLNGRRDLWVFRNDYP